MDESYALSTSKENPTYIFVRAFVDELQRAGVGHIVICPGSRSTPLAMVIAEQEGLHAWMHVDERSAAFFGLGLAKRLQAPVALLCTSGTAAANFLPAIVEAKLTHVPLLVLTADRPPELRDSGAPQTIDQNRLYGTHVKWFVDVGLPEATNDALRYIRTFACRAVAQAQAVPAGPVHLNLPFREPLTPEPLPGQSLSPIAQRDPVAWEGRPGNAPYVSVESAPLGLPSQSTIAHLAQCIRAVKRGLIIAGPQSDPALVEPLTNLAQRVGYPLLADPLSQLRNSKHEHILSSYDAFLRSGAFVEGAEPELILRFGAMPTSKPLLLYLKHYAHCPVIVLNGYVGWEEPTHLATEVIHADPVALCQALLEQESSQANKEATLCAWLSQWQHADQVTKQVLQSGMRDMDALFEGRIFSELAGMLPAGATLYVGNSMPVRDLDTFFWGGEQGIHIMGNRGANGIDGMISSALGASAASIGDAPTMLVIGDLSFFHDLNGLLAAKLHRLNLTVILVNNDGGGIFSFLPQSAYPEHFELLFGTPTGLDFRLAVQMYGGRFRSITTWEQFRYAVRQGMSEGGLQVVEVRTERESNVTLHRQLWQVVEQALSASKQTSHD